MNTGSTTTFRRAGYGETIPDVTLASENLAQRVAEWKVVENYTGSDHQYITFTVTARLSQIQCRGLQTTRWNVAKMREDILCSVVRAGEGGVRENHGTAEEKANITMALIHEACDASMPRRSSYKGRKKAAYWWTDEIANLRKRCLKLRRKITRVRRRNPDTQIRETEEFANAKKELKRAIYKSKKRKWDELKADVDNDPWGLGYKIVSKKLGMISACTPMVEGLFPTQPGNLTREAKECAGEIPLFCEDELVQAAGSLRNGKAPGPDGVPVEAIKVVAHSCPQLLLRMYNDCLREGVYPKIWKAQRLVLISKGKGDLTLPSAYRPLCLLDTAGKLFEKLLQPRLLASVEDAGGLSPNQHGFRK